MRAAADRSTASVQRRTLLRHTRTRPRAAEAPESDPKSIGRYTVRRRLGVGGMSVVYEAHDERLDRPVALKLMLVDDEEEDRVRLLREAQALARLSHPNVVEVFEIGDHEGKAFVAMELVEGYTLDRWLRLRRRSPAEAAALFVQAGQGLAAAHEQGLVHRDFKPSNVLVGADGRVRVLDFGLVRESTDGVPSDESAPVVAPPDARASSIPSLSNPAWDQTLTKTGAVAGTPAYMSPEQLSRLPIGPASDQFSFCVALFESIYGLHPFVIDDNWKQLPYNVLEGRRQHPEPPREAPAALLRVLERGLEVRPEDRWPSMDVLLAQIRGAFEPRRPRVKAIALGIGALAAILWAVDPLADAADRDHCDEAMSSMNAAWNHASREELLQAWHGSGLPGAADTWARAQRRLTRHVDDWWAVYRNACETETPAVGSATCLQRQAESLAVRLEVMSSPDTALLHNVIPMIEELPAPDRCGEARHAEAAEARASEPPWAALLDRIDALSSAGQYEDAAAVMNELSTKGLHESSPRLSAELGLRRGILQQVRGELDAAAQSFEDSYLAAKPLGLDELSADAAIHLLQLHGEIRYRASEAERWKGHARAEVDRLGIPRLKASYLNAAGRALRSAGDLEEALQLHREALQLQREHLPADNPQTAASLFQIGSCLGLLGRGPEGLEYLEDSLNMYQQTLGPGHPRVAGPLTNIGIFLMVRGENAAALETFRQVLELHREAFPDNPLFSRFAYTSISDILDTQGKHEEAARMLHEYLDRYERAIEGEAFDEGHFQELKCRALHRDRDLAAALRPCKRALAVYEQELGPDHSLVSDMLDRMAGIEWQRGRFDEALAYFERSMATDRRAGRMVSMADTELEVAWMLWSQGELAQAREQLEGARARLADAEPNDETLGETLGPLMDILLAVLMAETGSASEALPLARAAMAKLEAGLGTSHWRLVYPLALLARIELASGLGDEARAQAERAIAVAEATDTDLTSEAALARFVLARSLVPDRHQRSRAISLARAARARLVTEGAPYQRDVERIDAWLEAQGASASP